ncbi:MAG TPA: peptidoglycan DD-metalloendopeptidase family protein [Bacteroidales bacterium]|nr:peptidoglycan DD-metalloendopeptidase family protein [Bacteroidales bacterium]
MRCQGKYLFQNIGWPLVFLMVFFANTPMLEAQNQSREALERNRREIEGEIRLINQMLQETRSTAEVSLSHLVMLNTRINRRERLLVALGREMEAIEQQIAEQSRAVAELTARLNSIRDSYAKMIRYAYLNRSSYQRIAFLFSAESFNQAFLRLRYMREYARHRQLQAQRIISTQEKLKGEIEILEQRKSEQQILMAEHQRAVSELNREKSEQDRTVRNLRRRERDLTQRLRRQERARQELQRSIERIIAEERRRSQEQARAEGRRVVPGTFALSPEEQIISDNFAGNRGRLPWPVERGVISGTFGVHAHPVLRNIQIVNNGIDISTVPGARARAVFDGTVSRVVLVPGSFYAVIIRHGDFLTVYSNISQVNVSNGDRVTIRQEIGTVATDTGDGRTMIHFEIWQGNQKLDPAIWLATQR